MRITIACVGKLKEKYLTAGVEEYAKRLQPFCKFEIVSINEEKMPQDPSDAEKEQVLEKETERLLKIIPDNSYVILLDLQGRQLTSPELAGVFDNLALHGVSHITFVIGGGLGCTDARRERAAVRWPGSKLTVSHRRLRLGLTEQSYRAFKISRGEKYHW